MNSIKRNVGATFLHSRCWQRRISSMNVFNRRVKRQQRNNAAQLANPQDYEYLRDEVARRIVDRLQDIQRDFPLALDLGCGSGHIYKELREDPGIGGIKELVQCEFSENLLLRDPVGNELGSSPRMVVDEEFLPFPENHFDLIISSLNLHWVNELPECLLQIQRCLKPDGVFLGAILGGESLRELRSAFIMAEEERLGGVGMHVSPFAKISDAGNLLQHAGFNLPTIDSDIIQVDYPNAFVLMDHLRCMGENAAPTMESTSQYTNRDTFLAAAAIYQELYGNEDGTVPATFEVIHMIGWSPHESQQKPKVRGSAQQSMKELGQSSNL